MKLLIIQQCGQHEKNKNFRESLNLQRALFRNGHNSIVWGSGYDNYNIPYAEIEKDCDAVLVLENHDTGWLPQADIGASKKLKIFWSIDSHVNVGNHIGICRKINPQIVLNAIEHHSTYFNFVPGRYWFPNCAPTDLIVPANVLKQHEVGFCGNINNRGSWLNLIEKRFKLKRDIFVIGQDMVDALSSYFISFNRNIADDINYRTFETCAAGTFLITNYTPGLERLFNIGKEIVVYNSEEDLLDKIGYYLSHQDELFDIASAGNKRTVKDHSFDKRAELLVEIISKYC